MIRRLKAVFRDGVFVPTSSCDLPDQAEVDLVVQGPSVFTPEVTDPDKKAAILREVTQRMVAAPWPGAGRRFTREELHERR